MPDDVAAKSSVDRWSPESLSKLARDIVTNLVFTDRHLRSGDYALIPQLFMPIAFGAFSGTSEAYRGDIGMLFEYFSEAGPRALNGYPMFMSFRYIGKADAELVWNKVDVLTKALEQI